MGKITFLMVFFLVCIIGCSPKKGSLEIITTGEVFVFRAPDDGAYLQGNERKSKSVAVLGEGVKLKVLDSYYGKDFLAYKIKTENGIEGFVILGDSFEVKKLNQE